MSVQITYGILIYISFKVFFLGKLIIEFLIYIYIYIYTHTHFQMSRLNLVVSSVRMTGPEGYIGPWALSENIQ